MTTYSGANLDEGETRGNRGKPKCRYRIFGACQAISLESDWRMLTAGIWESLVISLVAALAAYSRKFLTFAAAVAAAILGAIILALGGWDWALTTAGLFLATALLAQREERVVTGESGSTKGPRTLKQVAANGILLAVFAVLYRTGQGNSAFIAAFLGCAGAVAGDTWATAATQFTTSSPRLLTSGQRVPPGTPGAVTGVGIALTALAGFFASLVFLSGATFLDGGSVSAAICIVLSLAAIVGAVAGALFDSYLGAACQALYADANGRMTDEAVADNGTINSYVRGWRWLNNDLVNFSNSVAGALSAFLVWAAAGWLNLI